MPRTSIKKRAHFAAITFIVMALVMLVAFELYLRYGSEAEFIDPGELENRPLQYEGAIFCRHVFPRREQDTIVWGERRVHINRHGYRGPDFDPDKPPGAVRIMFYGGSAVFDSSAGAGGDWPRQVEKFLNDGGQGRAEVINAGVPGHASFDSLGRFYSEGHAFQPDYVVLYNSWNDIKYFKYDSPLLRSFNCYGESFDPRYYYSGPIDRFLCARSRLYLGLRELYYIKKLNLGPEGALPSPPGTSENITALGPKQYRLNLELFVEAVKSARAVPILMTQARLVHPDNAEDQKNRIRYNLVSMDHEQLLEAFGITDQIIMAVGRAKNVAVIDASKSFTGKDEIFDDQIHFTEKGSSEFARFVADHLRPIIAGEDGGTE